MTNVKYTSRNFYNDIINGNITNEVKEFAAAALAKMDERNKTRAATQTPSQKLAEQTKSDILAYMVEGTVYTAKAVAEALNLSSTQRASNLLMQMANSGKIEVQDYTPTGKAKDTVKGYTVKV